MASQIKTVLTKTKSGPVRALKAPEALTSTNAQAPGGAASNQKSAGTNQGPAGAAVKRNTTNAADAGGSKRNSGALAKIFGLKRDSANTTENPESQRKSSDRNANSPEAASLRDSWNRTLFDFKGNPVPGTEMPPNGAAVIPGTPPNSMPGNNGAGQNSSQQPQTAGPPRAREEMAKSNNGQSGKRGGSKDGEVIDQAVGTNLGGLANENEQGKVGNRVTFIVPYQPQTYGAVQPVNILPVGDCPYCRVGFVYTRFTFLGILLALIFFPIGIICCLLMQEQRCSYCGLPVGYVY